MAMLDPRMFDPAAFSPFMPQMPNFGLLNIPHSAGFPGAPVTEEMSAQPVQQPAGPPMSIAPPPQQESPGFFGSLSNGLANNSNTLLAMGAGLMSGDFGDAFKGAMVGGKLDREQRVQNLTQQALIKRGIPAEAAMLASQNPEVMKALIPQLFGGRSGTVINNRLVDPTTGRLIADFSDTKAPETKEFETPGGGKSAMQFNVKTGQWEPIPGIQGGGAGKPPAGYQWIDPADPSKGLSPIQGGPATHLPAETAGRIAMMDTAMNGFADARKELERTWGPIDRTMSILGAGDIGRAQRTVRTAIEATLRAMTGAAAPETEVSRYMDLFMPGQLDTPATAKQKLDLLQTFMANAKKTVTQGRVPANEVGWTDLGNGVRIREKK